MKNSGDRIQVTTLDWYRYLETWEDKCGGNSIRELYGKEAKDLSEAEWRQVMDDFQAELSTLIQATNAKTLIFGGGIAIKQEHRLLEVGQQFDGVNIQVSHLGEDAGLLGALTLLRA